MTKLKSKRLLSFLLSLAMIFTLVSVPVYADETDTGTEATTASTSVATVGDTSYESLSAAVAAVTTEGTETTITLTADTTESGSITVASGKNIVLDLAGHTVTMGSYTVSVYGSLTIQDSTATTEPSISDDYETVTYTSGKITSTTTGTTVTAFNGGTVTLAGGTVEATRGIALRAYNSSGVDSATTVNATGGYAVSQEFTVLVMGSKATANISGGVLVANDNAVVGGNGQSQYAGTSITISGGTLIGHIQTSGYVACGIYHPQEGTLTITGGTIYADGGCGILMRGGTLTMTGGTIITTATTNSGLTDGAGKVGDSRIVVDASGIIYDLDSNYYDVSNVSITLSEDVTVDSTDDAVTVVDTDGDYTDSTITITGGTYSSDVSAYYDTETYTTVTNADGSVTVVASDDVTDTAAASITVDGVTTYYSTLAAAVADVPVGTSADDLGTDTTITILRNIDDAEGVSIPSYVNLTIDFGGYTYTITGPGAGSSNTQTNAFQLLKDSNITMKNGTVQIAENPSRIYRIIQSYANLTLEDMTFYSANQLGGEDYCLSFNYGTVTIKGSTSIISSSSNVIAFDVYYWNNSAYADGTTVIFDEDYTGTITGVILYDTTDASKATLEINGSGTFGGVELSSSAESLDTASITITGGTFGNDVDEYCTTVYTTEVNDDGTYTVITAQVASITDSEGSTTYYSTLAKAFAAAQDGDTITLLEDVILNSSLVCDCGDETSVTLELNGCTITFAYDSDGQFNGETLTDGAWGLKVASGTLTIQDTSDNGTGGIQTADVNTCVDVVGAAGSSTLNITSGSYTTNSIYEAVVYASGSASVNISGGTFTNSATAYAYNSEYTAGLTLNIGNSSSATINVTGGTFYGRSPAEGDDYQTETASTFVNESYKASAISDENGDGFIVVEASAVAVVYDADGNYTGSYTTLKTAYAAVSDGGTMILVDDVTNEQLGASSSKAVTLDLNGHTISRSTGSVIDSSKGTLTITDSSETDSAIGTGMVKNTGGVAVKLTGGSVVLESGTLESTSSYAVTLSSGALTVNGGAVIAGSNANCIVYYTSGTLTINGGLFTVVGRVSDVTEGSVTSGAIVNAGSSATKTDDVQVSITGGVFQTYRPLLGTSINLEITGGYFLSKYSLNNYTPDGYGYTSGSSCTYLGVTYSSYYQVAHINFTLTVTSSSGDGTETTETSYYTTLVQAVNAAISAYGSNNSATITITLENDYETGKVPVEKAVKFTLDLNGYTLTSTDKGAFKIGDSNAEVTINDSSKAGTGTITTVDSASVTSSTTGLLQVVNGTLYITGGNFNQNAGNSVFVVSSGGTVSVSGGYFTSDPSDYVAEGCAAYTPTDNVDYAYVVLAGIVASVSDAEGATAAYYTSLEAAFAAAEDGDTVSVLADTTVSTQISVVCTVTLDLNGYTVSSADEYTGYLIAVSSGGSLTVSDSSESANGKLDAANRAILVYSGGTVSVTGGTVHGESIGIYSSGGTVSVSGGTVSCCDSSGSGTYTSYSAIYADGTSGGTVIITGGKVTGYRGLINWGSDVTITGGTVSADSGSCAIQQTGGSMVISDSAQISCSANLALFIQSASAIVDGGTISGYVGIMVQNGTLTVNGGNISGTSFGISTNGTNSSTYSNNTITINDGTISGAWGMYLPAVDSTTTVNGGTISGTSTGIEIRAGSLTVTGGTIQSTSESFETQTNGGGTTVIGAGIAVSQHSTNQDVTVTVTGGTISGYYGVYELNTYASTNSSAVVISITADEESENEPVITATGDGGQAIYSKSVSNGTNNYTTVAISDGTFSTSVNPEYCADGYTPTTQDEKGNYTVDKFYLGLSTDEESAEESVPATIYSEEDGIMYVKVSSENISKYSNETYPTTTATFTNDGGDSHNYVFGGWYSYDTDTYNEIYDGVPAEAAYAKFVDADLLTVQCFVTNVSGSIYWRFVTSVDNGKYLSAGFNVTTGGETVTMSKVKYYSKSYTITNATTQVYSDGSTTSYEAGKAEITPASFDGSKYIVTAMTASPTEATAFTVTPYWVTADGTTVYGAETTFSYSAATATKD